MNTEEREPEFRVAEPEDDRLDLVAAANDPIWHAEELPPDSEAVRAAAEKISRDIELAEIDAIERQFNERHEFLIGKEKLKYALINPPLELMGEHADTEWVIFIGGLGAVKETYHNEMIDLALSGKRVIFVAPDKGVAPIQRDEDYFLARAGALPETIQNKASAVALLLEHFGITHANIIGHSQGGAVATALAGMRPGLAKKLLLDNPVGLIEGDTTRGLLSRVAHEAKVEAGVTKAFRNWGIHALELLRNPLWRATKEIPSIAHTDIRPILAHMKQLKEQGGVGPEVVLINSHSDQIYDPESIEKGLGVDPLNQYIDRYVVRVEKEAGHQKFGTRSGAELALQIMDEHSLYHQIITERNTENKAT